MGTHRDGEIGTETHSDGDIYERFEKDGRASGRCVKSSVQDRLTHAQGG